METEWVLASRRIWAGLVLLLGGGYVLYTGEQIPDETRVALDAAFEQTLVGIVMLVASALPILSRLRPKQGATDPTLTMLPSVLRGAEGPKGS